jgi:hypothetical protein
VPATARRAFDEDQVAAAARQQGAGDLCGAPGLDLAAAARHVQVGWEPRPARRPRRRRERRR